MDPWRTTLGLAAVLAITACQSSSRAQDRRPATPDTSPARHAVAPASLIAGRLAKGERYFIVARRDLFPLRSEGRDLWFTITGYYVPANGTWTSEAAGFPSPGTAWHSCPGETYCGGVHERGLVLERRYRPEDHELVALGQRLTFDEEGRVFSKGRHVGFVMAGDIRD